MRLLTLALGLFAVSMTPALHQANGYRTDVFQTSMGELRITPLPGPSLDLQIYAHYIYVDPDEAASSYRQMPHAAVILLTGAVPPPAPDVVKALRVASTQVIAPRGMGVIGATPVAPGQRLEVTMAGITPLTLVLTGVPAARGVGYVVAFGGTNLYVSGAFACNDAVRRLKDIRIAVVDYRSLMAPQQAAQCVGQFQPRVVYPYPASQWFKTELAPLHKTDVRLVNWSR